MNNTQYLGLGVKCLIPFVLTLFVKHWGAIAIQAAQQTMENQNQKQRVPIHFEGFRSCNVWNAQTIGNIVRSWKVITQSMEEMEEWKMRRDRESACNAATERKRRASVRLWKYKSIRHTCTLQKFVYVCCTFLRSVYTHTYICLFLLNWIPFNFWPWA